MWFGYVQFAGGMWGVLFRIFAPTAELYKAGTTFDEAYALYEFDREVHHIYLKYLLKVENSFKTVLAHEFSHLYGHDNYLKLENFHKNHSKQPWHFLRATGFDVMQFFHTSVYHENKKKPSADGFSFVSLN